MILTSFPAAFGCEHRRYQVLTSISRDAQSSRTCIKALIGNKVVQQAGSL